MKIANKNSIVVSNIADCALIALLKIVIKLNTEESVLRYRNDPDINRQFLMQ